MRKEIAAGLGLVVLLLVTIVLIIETMPPAKPPLRVGMSGEEQRASLGQVAYNDRRHEVEPTWPEVERRDPGWCRHYVTEPDWLGAKQQIDVYEGGDRLVEKWEIKPLPRKRPPWLDRALKAVGW
jgi:hypothetical protein